MADLAGRCRSIYLHERIGTLGLSAPVHKLPGLANPINGHVCGELLTGLLLFAMASKKIVLCRMDRTTDDSQLGL